MSRDLHFPWITVKFFSIPAFPLARPRHHTALNCLQLIASIIKTSRYIKLDAIRVKSDKGCSICGGKIQSGKARDIESFCLICQLALAYEQDVCNSCKRALSFHMPTRRSFVNTLKCDLIFHTTKFKWRGTPSTQTSFNTKYSLDSKSNENKTIKTRLPTSPKI